MSRTAETIVPLPEAAQGEAPQGVPGDTRGPRLLFARVLCALGAAVALVALLGWLLDQPLLRSAFPGAVEMKVNTALCLGMLAAALFLRSAATSGLRLLLSRGLAVLAGLTGFITLLEYGLGWNAGIDELLFVDTAHAYASAPGRMSPFSAVAFVLLGTGLAGPVSLRWRGVVIATALLTCAIGCVSVMGYLLGASELTTDDWVPPVAVNTATVLCLLGLTALLIDPLVADFWRLPRSAGSLHTKLVVGFGLALVLLCAGGAFAYRMQQRAAESNHRLSQAGEIRHALGSVQLSMADAETAHRNYLLLGDAVHKQQFETLVAQMQQQLVRLDGIVADGDPQVARLAQLAALLEKRQQSLHAHLQIAERSGLAAASSAIAASSSAADRAALHELMETMDGHERRRIDALSRAVVQNRNYTLAALVSTVAVATVTLVLLFLSIMRELRERSRVTTALGNARAEAQRATRAKSEFLAAMSHEIRTPMNGVIGMLDLLEQSSLQNQQLEMVRLTRESADSLLGIIEDILDFSKIEAGRMELERAPLSLANTVERACMVLDRLAERQGVQLAVYCDPALPETVTGDPTRVRQVLINLVNNAIKFSGNQDRPGIVAVRTRLVQDGADRVLVEFTVSDNGIGMDEATLDALFVPFMQADLSTTRRFGGTGLGLAISHQLVTLMGGEIKVRSQTGSGTTFTACLPFDVAMAAPPLSTELGDIHCLVIGPDSGMAMDLAAYLAAEGATVHRLPRLPGAADAAAVQLPRGRTTVWVVESDETPDPVEDMLDRAESAAGAEAGIVLVIVGRKRRIAPATAARRVIINGNALSRAALVRAVKVAAGSAPAVVEPVALQARLQRQLPTRAEAIRRGQLVLVAEDNATNQKVVLQQLRLLGYVADIAGDGEAALQMWQRGDYALLLTDLHMPKMDGYDLALAIRTAETRQPRIPIVALTANALPGEGERCREAGMDGYLTKPATLAALGATLNHWLPLQAAEPAVDLGVLRALVGDDPETIRELLQDYCGNASTLGVEIERASAAGRSHDAASAAHRLKSSSRSVGALPLGTICEAIEQAGNASDLPAVANQLGALRMELNDVLTTLAGELDPEAATGTGP